MKSKVITATCLTLLATAHVATAAGAVPAWQEPGFVMEEVIATAPRVTETATPAWQEPGYVMEEVVVTAPRSEASWAQAHPSGLLPRHHAITAAMRPLIRHLAWELVRRSGKLDIQFDPLTIAP